MSVDSSAAKERVWEEGWDGHRKAQQKRMASMTFRQKLDWLEEAHRLVIAVEKARSKPRDC